MPPQYVFETPYGCFGIADADLGHRAEAPVTLEQVAPAVNSKLRYTYDFGDDWDHDILVENVLKHNETAAFPRCTGGRRARDASLAASVSMTAFNNMRMTPPALTGTGMHARACQEYGPIAPSGRLGRISVNRPPGATHMRTFRWNNNSRQVPDEEISSRATEKRFSLDVHGHHGAPIASGKPRCNNLSAMPSAGDLFVG